MKLLYYLPYTPADSRAGGGDIVFWETARELHKMGHEVTVCSLSSEVPADVGGLDIEVLGGSCAEVFDYGTSKRLVERFGKTQFDVVHGLLPEMLLTIRAAERRNIPTVYEVHFPQFKPYTLGELLSNGRPNGVYALLRFRLDAYCARQASMVLTPSEYSLGMVSRIYGVDVDKVLAAYNGVDLEIFHKMPVEREERIISVSRLDSQKGLDVLLRAYRIVIEKRPGVGLDIVGSGHLLDDLKEYCKKNGLVDVVFHGYQPAVKVAELMSRASMLVLSSRSESFGLVLVEASACGLPVVSTRVGATPEVVDDGITGLLVEPDNPGQLSDAILRLLEDTNLGERMGDAGAKMVRERFSWASRAKLIDGVYRALVR